MEVVDFILHSADHVLRQEFGKGLASKDVHILDPFTGTRVFLVRLLRSESRGERDESCGILLPSATLPMR